MKIRLAGVIRESIVDGPGIRFVVFTQGCKHGCKGCQNPETHDMDGGYLTDTQKIVDAVKQNKIIKGVTLSGGDPLFQPKATLDLCQKLKAEGYDIMIYTGYVFENLLKMNDEDILGILKLCDTLVDGPFILEKRSLSCRFRGSTNQRLIDVQASLEKGEVILRDWGENEL